MKETPGFLYLPDTTLDTMDIPPAAVADAIEKAIHDKVKGRLHTTPKSVILPGQERYVMSTLAVGDGDRLTVLKQVTVSPANPDRGLPAINGAILAMDAETGLLRAVLGANWVTAARTAALSAVAARRLANPASQILALVGTGVQAHSHLAAFADLFPLTEIRAFGRGRANVDKLCDTARAMGLEAKASATPLDALDGADLVVSSVTLDYSISSFLDARWMKPGSFAAITDSGIPWHDENLGAFGTVVIDDREQEDASARKQVPPDLVQADLTELVSGQTPLTFDPAKSACFAFRGLGLGDYAATALAVSWAVRTGAGIRVEA